jgi:putative transferase (TIGR04331 family)
MQEVKPVNDRPGPELLVLTAIEETWGSNEPIAFLGEWCQPYDRRDVWMRRRHRIVPYHWDDREKLHTDHEYLKRLHDLLLADLSQAMNRYHGIERPPRYWQMILDPWLLTYIAAVWDRWECLRKAFENGGRFKTIALESIAGSGPIIDYDDFIEKVRVDSWNCRLYLDIIRSSYSDQCSVIEQPGKPLSVARLDALVSASSAPHSAKYRLAELIDAVLGRFSNRNRVLFFQSYFPLSALLRLNLHFWQLPRLYLREFEWKTPADSASIARRAAKRSFSLSCDAKNAFEIFLFQRITKDIPCMYLEDFPAVQARAAAIPMKPRVILTANAHWNNGLFKLWAAEQVLAGVRFVTMEHGGGLYPTLCAMFFEEEIADYKTTWAIPFHKKQVSLPPNKLVTLKFKAAGDRLGVVGVEISRYAYRADAAPKSGQNLVGCNMICELYPLLAGKIQARFQVKPYPNQGWNTRQRLIDNLGKDKVSDEKNYYRFLLQARMVVCTYPQTTFSEAMASGVPTILFYPTRLWETIPEFDPLLEKLRTAGIVFHDARSAAAHINRVWDEPDKWWNSPDVSRARNEFHRQAADLSGDWARKWTAFIDRVLAEDVPHSN